MSSAPQGLTGIRPRNPIGVAVTVGIKSAKSGAPVLKDRFWMMSPHAASKEFQGSGRAYKALAREMHPAFEAWNRMAKGSMGVDDRQRDPRSAVLRGNIVHSELGDAVFWNRSAQKLPEPHPNPPSQRPACEGNGVWARRFEGVVDGLERFGEISCPNEACIFAQQGLCKVFASLLFQLRWDREDAFQGQFPATLAMWSTRGVNSARNLLGLFEYVLGTEAIAPWTPKEDWKPGLAQELGIVSPSLFGLPFTMTVGEKTGKSHDGKEGRRFPVVSFSPDGDLVAWLVHQRRQRELAAGADRLALPAYVTTREPDYIDRIRHEARVELDPSAVEFIDPEHLPQPEPKRDGPVLLSPAKCATLRALAADHGDPEGEALAHEAARLCGSGTLENVPAAYESDLLKFITTRPGSPGAQRRKTR